MAHHIIRGLALASEHPGPACYTAKRRRPRGAKGVGVKYEKDLARKLGPSARHGQWFEFYDASGRGYAQTDFLLFASDGVFCLEAKLGNIELGMRQFALLYRPLLEHIYGLPAYGIVCARHIGEAPDPKLVVTSLHDATRLARMGHIPVLHWRERLPLVVPPGLGPLSAKPAPRRNLSA